MDASSPREGDNAEQQRRLAEYERTNRALRVLSSINRALIHATTEADIIHQTCRIAVEVGGYRMVWVGFAEHDPAKTVRPICHVGHEDGFLKVVRISWADTPQGCGPTGTAIRTRQPVLIPDITEAPEFAPWRDEAMKRGYRSVIALPLFVDHDTLGAISLYNDHPEHFTPEEEQLLTEMSANLAFGIMALRTRERQQRAEEALRNSEERFRSLFQTMTEGAALHELIRDEKGTPIDYRILDINPAYTHHTGITAAQARGASAKILYHTDPPPYLDVYVRVAETGSPESFETFFPPLQKYFAISVCSPGPDKFATIFEDITERKQIESALAQEKIFTDAVLDSVPGLLYVYDEQGHLIRWNKKHEELTGYSADELRHKQLLDWFQGEPEDTAKIVAGVEKAFHEGYSQSEAHLLTKGGTRLLYFFTAVRMNLRGRVYFVGIGIDITERNRVEDALRKSEERFRALFQRSPLPMAIYRDSGAIEYLNDRFVTTFGYTRDDIPTLQQWWPLAYPDEQYRREVMTTWNAMLEQAERTHSDIESHEFRVTGKDGVERIMEIFSTKIGDRNLAIWNDITARKQAENALRKNEAMLRAIYDAALNISLIITDTADIEPRVLEFSPGAERIFGYTREEMLGQPVNRLHRQSDIEQFPAVHEAMRRGKTGFSGEMVLIRKNGEAFPALFSTYPLFDDQGRMYAALGVTIDISELRRAEEALRLSQFSIEKAADSIFWMDFDGRLLYVNEAGCRSLQYSLEELQQMTVFDIDPIFLRERWQEHSERLRREGSFVIKTCHRRKNGETFPVEISINYIKYDSKEYNFAFARDITERKRAEETLRQSEERLSLLIRNSPDVMYILDTDLRYIWIPKNIIDNPRANMVGVTDRDLFPPEEADRLDAINRKVMATGENIRYDLTVQIAQGTLYFDNTASPWRDAEGRINGVVVYVHDITNLKLAEQSLARERAYLASAIDLLPFPILLTTPQQQIIRQNRASQALLHEPNSPEWWEVQLLDPHTRAPIPRRDWPLTRALRGEVTPTTEWILALPNGQETPVLLQSSPVYIDSDLVAAAVAFQDISALKEADKAKNQFLMMLSHEVKTPLTSIIGWAQMAQSAPDIVPEALVVILRNAGEQKTMLERLLILSRILTGKLLLRCTPFDLWQLVEETSASFQMMAREKRIELQLDAPATDLPITADRKFLQQAIHELLDNAVRFTEAGGRIVVTGQQKDHYLMLSVRDTGRGIPPEQLPLLLKPFQQLQREEAKGGLGIGLALVRGIVDTHGGRATITSPGPGQGATVTLKLPPECRPPAPTGEPK